MSLINTCNILFIILAVTTLQVQNSPAFKNKNNVKFSFGYLRSPI